jgi:hemerythrin
MALMKWSEQLSVGVKAMDGQHVVLIETLNELHAALTNGEAHTIVGPLLGKLLSYTNTHFSAEEALMEASAFPGLAQHRILHRDLIKQIEVFSGRFERGEEMLSIHLMNFLRDWLSTHILQKDKEYGLWMNKHELY